MNLTRCFAVNADALFTVPMTFPLKSRQVLSLRALVMYGLVASRESSTFRLSSSKFFFRQYCLGQLKSF